MIWQPPSFDSQLLCVCVISLCHILKTFTPSPTLSHTLILTAKFLSKPYLPLLRYWKSTTFWQSAMLVLTCFTAMLNCRKLNETRNIWSVSCMINPCHYKYLFWAGSKTSWGQSNFRTIRAYLWSFFNRPKKVFWYLVHVWLDFERKGGKHKVALQIVPFCKVPRLLPKVWRLWLPFNSSPCS